MLRHSDDFQLSFLPSTIGQVGAAIQSFILKVTVNEIITFSGLSPIYIALWASNS